MLKYSLNKAIMQLLNIILFWVFFGLLCSHLAKKRGKRQLPWFFIGLILGIFGVILIYILPSSKEVLTKSKPNKRADPLERSDAWMKMWYYQEPTSKLQKGPMEFPDLAKQWHKKALTEKTLIWGEGMPEWKKVHDLPDIVKEMEKV